MDRDLPEATRRRNRLRAAIQISVPVAALATIVALLPGWIRPTLSRARIRTAAVQAGAIEAVITASGTVVPGLERILSSPVDARLLQVLKRPGATVATGEPVAELDLGETRLALDRITSTLALSDNKRDQARLALDTALADVDARIERKALDLELLEQKAASSGRLAQEGLVSQQGLSEARLAAKQAAIELAQLRREREVATRSTALEAEGLALERQALVKEAGGARRTLDLATMRSDRGGVVTWTVTQEGALVRKGEIVAKIADLASFAIDATVSDLHAGRLRTGMPVRVAVNDETLPGSVAEIFPAIENGVIRFRVALADPSHRSLRPNMRVDVHVVTDRRPRTLSVRQGPFVSGGDRGDVFVIRGSRAVRTEVRFGLRGVDDIEILGGLEAGDDVVISDMRDYMHLRELEVR